MARKMKVRLGEDGWLFDEGDITLEDAFVIKAELGLALRPFLQGIADMDPDCLQGLVWFCRRKAGERVSRSSVKFRILDLDLSQDEEDEQDPPPEAVATP